MRSPELRPIPGLVPQKDGSYALTIECDAGCCPPDVLGAVTQIAKEHGALVHLTMGQKIMLLGLDQGTGPKVLAALEAAGAKVRKARDLSQPRVCVGKPYCPLALQETFPLARHLYRELARVPVPPKLKVGISGCPACCSWANLMDLGFTGLRGGFKVIVGGHGGYRPREGQVVGRVSTYEEASGVLSRLAALFAGQTAKKGRVDRVVKELGLEEVKRRLGL